MSSKTTRKHGIAPFVNHKVLSPGTKPASTSSATGFMGRPNSYCLLTFYFEPIERQLFFGLDSAEFFIIGKMYAIGGCRVKAGVIEVGSMATLSPDSVAALRIGLIGLTVHAKDYFGPDLGGILFSSSKPWPSLDRAIATLLDGKGWIDPSALAFDGAEGEWSYSAAVPVFRGFDMERFITTYLEGTLRALEALESGGHWRDLFVLLQCSIDHLAWLSRPAKQDDVTCSDFCRWVHRYLRLRGDGSLTAGEVYNWRCGWVHTYGGQQPRKYGGLALANQHSLDYERGEGVTVVGVRNLLRRYREAQTTFAIHCSLDSTLRALVNQRLMDMPQVVPV